MATSTTDTLTQPQYEEEKDFSFKTFLLNKGFTEYDKIEPALLSGKLTLEDLLDCNDKELNDELESYGITTIQRKRFIRSIKALSQSKADIDAETGLLQTDSFLNYLKKIKLEKTGKWILSIINIDGLKDVIGKTNQSTVNFKITTVGMALNKYCQQLPTRLIPFKHNKNKLNQNDVFAILFKCNNDDNSSNSNDNDSYAFGKDTMKHIINDI